MDHVVLNEELVSLSEVDSLDGHIILPVVED
jgi:hypothetical protein